MTLSEVFLETLSVNGMLKTLLSCKLAQEGPKLPGFAFFKGTRRIGSKAVSGNLDYGLAPSKSWSAVVMTALGSSEYFSYLIFKTKYQVDRFLLEEWK